MEVSHIVGLIALIVLTIEAHYLVTVQVEYQVRLPAYVILTITVDVYRVQCYLDTLVAYLTYIGVCRIVT